MKASVSEKGQVTIPKPIREKLGLRPGSVIEFQTRNGTLIGKKTESSEDPVIAVTGIIKLSEAVDEYLAAVRGEVK